MQEYEVDDYEINDSFFDGYKPKKLISDVKKNDDKFKCINRVILDYLELKKGTGSTIPGFIESLGIERNTISKHLTYLVATRQVYKINDSVGVYHKNGRICHYKDMEKKNFDNKLYKFFQLQGFYGEDRIYIQEKEIGKLRSVTVKGGIMIEKSNLLAFINELTKFHKEIEMVER